MRYKITMLANKFRKAIIKTDRNKLIITLKNFPKGACGDASLLLSRFLNEKGICPIYYVSAVKKHSFNSQSHAWLEINDLIIDITASQFEEINQDVIITKNRNWYSQFKIERKLEYRKGYFNDDIEKELDDSYKNIIKNL